MLGRRSTFTYLPPRPALHPSARTACALGRRAGGASREDADEDGVLDQPVRPRPDHLPRPARVTPPPRASRARAHTCRVRTASSLTGSSPSSACICRRSAPAASPPDGARPTDFAVPTDLPRTPRHAICPCPRRAQGATRMAQAQRCFLERGRGRRTANLRSRRSPPAARRCVVSSRGAQKAVRWRTLRHFSAAFVHPLLLHVAGWLETGQHRHLSQLP